MTQAPECESDPITEVRETCTEQHSRGAHSVFQQLTAVNSAFNIREAISTFPPSNHLRHWERRDFQTSSRTSWCDQLLASTRLKEQLPFVLEVLDSAMQVLVTVNTHLMFFLVLGHVNPDETLTNKDQVIIHLHSVI